MKHIGEDLGYVMVGDVNDATSEEYFHQLTMRLREIGSNHQVFEWRNELFSDKVNSKSIKDTEAWFETIRLKYGRKLVGRQECIKRVALAMAELSGNASDQGKLAKFCFKCKR